MGKHRAAVWYGLVVMDIGFLVISIMTSSILFGICAFLLAVFLAKKPESASLLMTYGDKLVVSKAKIK